MDRIHRMSRGRKTLLSLLLVGTIGTVAGIGTFSAFSATTVNAGNVFAAGSVVDLRQRRRQPRCTPSRTRRRCTPVVRCIEVTYTGSLPADVHLYSSAIGAIGPFVDLTIDKGTGSTVFPNCAGFVPDASPNDLHGDARRLRRGELPTSPTARPAFPGVQTAWNQNDVVVYRFTLTLQNNSAAAGTHLGAHSFTWEAQNQ